MTSVKGKRFTATAQKPESKLWHHDGTWWATLYRPEAHAFRIHRFERASETWVDTGTLVDERARSRQDTLWDGQHLYVASRFGEDAPQNRLSRYHYDGAGRVFVLDAGFPVDLPGGGTEALTIAKDSSGALRLVDWPEARIYVNGSLDAPLTNEWNHVVITSSTPKVASDLRVGDFASAFLSVPFEGAVDELLLFEQERSPEDIATPYVPPSECLQP